ncbi:HutD family protein [Aquimarina sp. I32.4]|uniref:HutD/Ves family protein n=1 Tax=Aquimarina sp. I32.4 TaxID=2053903 RepID=UPI000CDEAD80|nr:HutD family protein [Aquimarina sp. I32.4]
MEITIVPSQSFKTTSWAGGDTTQFYMYPPDSKYQQLDFDFRLSMATVVAEESVFTPLPDISRKLMVLDGTITLKHENRYSKQLSPYDVDEFEGGWETSSFGQCTDFNLMTSGTTTGELKAFDYSQNKQFEYHANDESDWLFVYVYAGNATINIQDKKYSLNKGDLLAIHSLTSITTIHNHLTAGSILVIAEIANQK